MDGPTRGPIFNLPAQSRIREVILSSACGFSAASLCYPEYCNRIFGNLHAVFWILDSPGERRFWPFRANLRLGQHSVAFERSNITQYRLFSVMAPDFWMVLLQPITPGVTHREPTYTGLVISQPMLLNYYKNSMAVILSPLYFSRHRVNTYPYIFCLFSQKYICGATHHPCSLERLYFNLN